VAGISSASLSFGYINSWFSYRLHACVLLTILLLQSSREIVGPLVGGALTEAFSFQTSAVVFGEFLLAEVSRIISHSTQPCLSNHSYSQGSLLLGVALIDWRFGT
jgi:hypothetical protein